MEDQVWNRSLLSMKWKILVLCLKINHRSIDVLNLKVTTYMRSRFIRGMICVCSTYIPGMINCPTYLMGDLFNDELVSRN